MTCYVIVFKNRAFQYMGYLKTSLCIISRGIVPVLALCDTNIKRTELMLFAINKGHLFRRHLVANS